jgi:heme oxygenase (biliverdin-IX-beta and delta-forming)
VFKERRDLNLQKLRQETEADHRNVEGAVSLMHQGLNTAEYVQCLQSMYGVVAAWEERAAEIAPEWLQPSLLARRRSPLLALDLAWFGVGDKEHQRPALPQMNNLPSLFGTMYVMEGSTLGGQLIARHVEAVLPCREGQGSSYFRGHGSQTGPLWKEFCEMLKLHVPDEQTETVVVSAKAMFSTFGTWMQRKSAMDGS